MGKATTLKDIATIAGVSVATVSLALNGKPEGRVSAEIVDYIEEIARKLNYQPTAPKRKKNTTDWSFSTEYYQSFLFRDD